MASWQRNENQPANQAGGGGENGVSGETTAALKISAALQRWRLAKQRSWHGGETRRQPAQRKSLSAAKAGVMA